MLLRLGLFFALAAVAIVLTAPQPWTQQPWAQTLPPSTKPEKAPAASPPGATTQPGDPFGEDTTLIAKPIVYVKGSGTWDNAFETITKSLKTVKAYIDKEGLKSDGEPMTLFTSTDDAGFQFEAAVPVAAPPKTPPRGDVAVGTSPAGRALKFVHRGSYDGLDNTYEAVTNYLDERRLEAKDMFIEQYVTDPSSTNAEHLVVNVLVLIK